jgi:hypothetical protein
MNSKQRCQYFTEYWPNACAAKGWHAKDDSKRRGVTAECMRAIGAPGATSTSDLGEAEITALFLYLRLIALPDNLQLLHDWDLCKEDYQRFNTMRQGDWWQGKTGYKRRGKLEKRRFQNRPTQNLFDREEHMSKEDAEHYLMTMRARAKSVAKRKVAAAAATATPVTAPVTSPEYCDSYADEPDSDSAMASVSCSDGADNGNPF